MPNEDQALRGPGLTRTMPYEDRALQGPGLTRTMPYNRGVKLIFTEGHIRLMAALKGPVVTNTV